MRLMGLLRSARCVARCPPLVVTAQSANRTLCRLPAPEDGHTVALAAAPHGFGRGTAWARPFA